MQSNDRLAELEATLGQLVPTLARLRETHAAQRAAVADNDLGRLVAVTAEQEEISARLAVLEQRRQAAQQTVELALGVHGLLGIAKATTSPAERRRLLTLMGAVRENVVGLQEENQRTAALLESAIDVSRRMRGHLQRVSGAESTYGPNAQRVGTPAVSRRFIPSTSIGAPSRPTEAS